MIRLISYSLLLSFFVLLTPRTAWHECEHDEHHQNVHQSSETHVEQDDCFACDFDLGFISQPIATVFFFEKTHFPKNIAPSTTVLYLVSNYSFSRRGPPQT
jgi:hypothetical protein